MKKEFVLLRTSAIKPYENNPRINDQAVDAVIESISQCEYIDPIEIDENNVILSGHTRLKALQKLKIKTADCIRVTGLTEEQKRKYRLLTNKTGELADWDLEKLGAELDDLDFDDFDFGFDLPEENDEPQEISEDNYEEPAPKQPKSKLGDIYELGNHRLICGDCTDKNVVDKLMNGEKADMVFTDPPYNVAIGSKNKVLNEKNHNKKGHRIETNIENDKGMTDAEIGEKIWKPAFENMRDYSKDCCSIYVTMPQGGSHMMMMMMMMMSASWQVKHELIWVKNQPTFSMGRLDYDYQHEPICYGWNKNHVFYGKGEFNKSIWQIEKPRESKLHPTMKPIKLITNALLNSTLKNNIVLDVFGGSGSTLIACEQLNRRCFMCELDPKYVDVIIDRWEKFTGKKAVKLN